MNENKNSSRDDTNLRNELTLDNRILDDQNITFIFFQKKTKFKNKYVYQDPIADGKQFLLNFILLKFMFFFFFSNHTSWSSSSRRVVYQTWKCFWNVNNLILIILLKYTEKPLRLLSFWIRVFELHYVIFRTLCFTLTEQISRVKYCYGFGDLWQEIHFGKKKSFQIDHRKKMMSDLIISDYRQERKSIKIYMYIHIQIYILLFSMWRRCLIWTVDLLILSVSRWDHRVLYDCWIIFDFSHELSSFYVVHNRLIFHLLPKNQYDSILQNNVFLNSISVFVFRFYSW